MKHFGVVSLILFLLMSYPCTTTTTPSAAGDHNTIAISGSPTVILNCSSYLGASVAFYFKHWTSNEAPDEIFDRRHVLNDYTSKYEVRINVTASAAKDTQDGVGRNSSNYFLNTRNAQDYHAGEYSCIENDGIGDHLSVTDLTVFDPTPRCNDTSLNSGSVSLRCEILFSGHAANVTILWAKTGNVHEFLSGGILTKLKNSYVTEIEVHPDSSSSDSTYVILIGNNCKSQPNSCFQLETELQVPRVATDSSTYDTNEMSTSIVMNNRHIWILVGSVVGAVLFISVVVISIICLSKRKCCRNGKQDSDHAQEMGLLNKNNSS